MVLIAQGQASLLRSLDVMAMPYRAYLQGAIWDAGFWWLCSAQKGLSGADGNESNHISKFDANGRYLGRMTLLGSGHGSAFAIRNGRIYIAWFEADESQRRIRFIDWVKDKKAVRSEAPVWATGTGTTAWITTPFDGDNLCLRRHDDNGYDYFSLRLVSAPATIRRRMRVRRLHPANKSDGTYQGSFTFGDSVFILYAATDDRPQQLAQVKWPADNNQEYTVAPVSVLDVTKIPADWGGFNSKEPEGLCAYNGRLCFGQRFGPTSNRAFRLYLFANIGPNAPPAPPPVTPWPPTPPPVDIPPNQCD